MRMRAPMAMPILAPRERGPEERLEWWSEMGVGVVMLTAAVVEKGEPWRERVMPGTGCWMQPA
jgi:hypothetical protein